MAQLLLWPGRTVAEPPVTRPARPRPASDPGAAARGVLLALALSSLVWIAIALLVPRLW